MRIPKQILGYTLTPAERLAFIKNNLSSNLVDYRIKKGWERSEWFGPKEKLKGNVVINRNIVSDERLKHMEEYGISVYLARKRMSKGMSFDEATTAPPLIVVDKLKMPKQEVIEVIGRIKYLNKQPDTIIPYCIPAGILKRAKEYKIDIDKVKELPV